MAGDAPSAVPPPNHRPGPTTLGGPLAKVIATAAAAGAGHLLILDRHGHVYSLGSNSHGQLGQGAGSEPARVAAEPARVTGLDGRAVQAS